MNVKIYYKIIRISLLPVAHTCPHFYRHDVCHRNREKNDKSDPISSQPRKKNVCVFSSFSKRRRIASVTHQTFPHTYCRPEPATFNVLAVVWFN